jgi:hypothetical protein
MGWIFLIGSKMRLGSDVALIDKRRTTGLTLEIKVCNALGLIRSLLRGRGITKTLFLSQIFLNYLLIGDPSHLIPRPRIADPQADGQKERQSRI